MNIKKPCDLGLITEWGIQRTLECLIECPLLLGVIAGMAETSTPAGYVLCAALMKFCMCFHL